MTTEQLTETITTAAGVSPFRDLSDNPKTQAQRNLEGRTHYVSDSTLKFHHSRIMQATPIFSGLYMTIVESCALDYQNTRRGFRVVVFDLWGRTVHCPKLEQCATTKAAALRQFAAADIPTPAAYYAAKLKERAVTAQYEAARMIEAAKNLEVSA